VAFGVCNSPIGGFDLLRTVAFEWRDRTEILELFCSHNWAMKRQIGLSSQVWREFAFRRLVFEAGMVEGWPLGFESSVSA
jgi:hypothetical protein